MVLLSHLRHMKSAPNYLLIENVVGFEQSQTHKDMLQTLCTAGFVIQVQQPLTGRYCPA